MKERELRRSLAVLPMSTVMALTGLTARQIRYYEEQNLVIPERNAGNRRLYSLDNIDELLDIKDFLADGLTIARVKKKMAARNVKRQPSSAEVNVALEKEFATQSRFFNNSPTAINHLN